MNTKKLLFFGVILIALIGYIYKIQIPAEEAKQEAKLWLGGAVPKEISEVTIKQGDKIFTLKNSSPVKYSADEKKGDTSINIENWRLADLPEAKLDAGAVNSLVTTLTNLIIENPIPKEEQESDLSVYGLDKPSIEATTMGKTLLVGKQSEYSAVRYLKTTASDDIYAVSSFAYDSLAKNAKDLRNHTPISFDNNDIQSFTIHGKNGPIGVENTAESQWQITIPLSAKASSNAISEYLNQLRGIRVKDFFDGENKKNLSKDLTVAITFKDQKTHPKPLTITLSGDQFMIDGENVSYSTEGDKSFTFDKPLKDFREKKFVAIDPEQTKKLAAEFSNGEKYVLDKDSGSWKIDGAEADSAFVVDLLTSLSELEASDFATEKEKALVESAELKYTFNNKTLSISKEQMFNNSKVRFAIFTDDPTVYVLTEDKYKRIARKKESLTKAA